MRGHPKTELERAQRKAEADPATWDEANELDADLAASVEEHAVGTFLRAMVAAGCELHFIDRTRLTVDEAVERLLEAGRHHTGHTVLIRSGSTYLDISGWIGWL